MLKKIIAKLFLRLTGWAPEGEVPTAPKYVLIAAPHTSNWDLAYTLAFAAIFDVKVKWMGKHTLFKFPYGWLMRRLGGLPIRRHQSENVVEQSAALFDQFNQLALTVPAEGTRSRVDYWKSGFYYIADKARVPIILGFLDYGRKRGGFGPAILPSGDVNADMDRIREFYRGMNGKYPDKFAVPRLRVEDRQAV